MKTAARIINALGLFLIILILLLYLLIAFPRYTPLQTHEITSGSMEPAILTGSLTFTREVSFEELSPGDVIVFSTGSGDDTVTHRIIEVNTASRELKTKGDANELEDLRPVKAENVKGRVIFSVPLLGFIEGFFTTPEGKAASGSMLLGAVILKILGGRLEKSRAKKEAPDSSGAAAPSSQPKKKKKKKSSSWLDALLLLFICAALFALYKLVSPLVSHKVSAEEYESLEEYVSMPQSSITPLETAASDIQPEEELPADAPAEVEEEYYFPWEVEWPEVDFDALKEINPDVVAWLYIEDTQINYPIVKGPDNDYYLNRSFKGAKSAVGSMFLDYRNSESFTDLHANIYGHHINNGSMMAGIVKYKDQSFYESHPYGLLMTPEANYLIEFYSGFIAEAYDDAWQVQFSSYGEYENWIDRTVERSLFASGAKPARNNQVLTLSTCTYEFYDARFVLHGILWKEPPETIE